MQIYMHTYTHIWGFLGSSAGKESACNTGRPQVNSWIKKIPWRRVGYPLQYSWAFLVAQTVKNLPALWET